MVSFLKCFLQTNKNSLFLYKEPLSSVSTTQLLETFWQGTDYLGLTTIENDLQK